MPPEFTLRPPAEDEVGAVVELINASGQHLHGQDVVDVPEVRVWFTSPTQPRELNLRVAELSDGTLAGVGAIVDMAEDHSQMWLRIILHPQLGNEEIGEALLATAETRARETAVEGSRIHAPCSSKSELLIALYGRSGYTLVRHFLRMGIELDEKPPEPVWPEGIELRPLDPERDLRSVFAADEEAFEDHWGFVRIPYEDWKHMMTGGHFDPSLWVLAYARDELAGFSLNHTSEGGDPELGWVGVLGVRRPWRRRGLALALLEHSFGEFRRRGCTRAGLDVDAENLTGALRLYERAGMAITRRSDVFEKVL